MLSGYSVSPWTEGSMPVKGMYLTCRLDPWPVREHAVRDLEGRSRGLGRVAGKLHTQQLQRRQIKA